MRIVIDLEKGVDQNASMYFDKAKKLKKKMGGVKKAILDAEERHKKELEKVEKRNGMRNLDGLCPQTDF